MFPHNQKISPPAPAGHYYWIDLDISDDENEPLMMYWYLQLRKHRKFWFDKVVYRSQLARHDQTREITPALLDKHAEILRKAYRDNHLSQAIKRNFQEYVQ